jgi:hypothetical protein
MRERWVGILMATIGCLGVAAWAQQGQPRPGPGSGVVTVQGTVDVGNSLAVSQEGDWKMTIANTPAVTVANTPAVSLAPLAFVKAGVRYQVVWSSGETERIAAAELGTGGWVRVAGPERWINLAQARSVATLP